MKKIRILQFPIANSNGGITHYALNNWKWMNKDQFECDFATMSKKLDFADEIIAMGSKIHYISCYAEENPEQFKEEFRDILKQGYDVVHIHTKQWKGFLVENLCREANVPRVIVHAHNAGVDIEDNQKRQVEIDKHEAIKKKIDDSLATDFWACSWLAADFIFGDQITKNKIVIMHNAIELDKFAYSQKIRDEYRKRYGLENSFVIGHAGRFEYQKNHEFLIDVFDILSRTIDSAKLVLLGDGRLISKIKQKVKKLELEDKILFLGNRTDINNWYQVMDVFCLPSWFEGLPIVLVEAQASGLPCVISENITEEVRIIQELVRLPLDKSQWVQQIIKYLECNNRKDRKKKQKLMTDAGYDIRHQIKIVEQYYKAETAKNC